MKVLKFGGTSLGSPERIRGVKKIIESQSSPCLIVVSAFQGITDDLKHLSELASNREDEYEILIEQIIGKHIEYSRQLINGKKLDILIKDIQNLASDLKETINGIYLLRELSKHSLDQVLAAGELLSSLIISNFIEDSQLIDARLSLIHISEPTRRTPISYAVF